MEKRYSRPKGPRGKGRLWRWTKRSLMLVLGLGALLGSTSLVTWKYMEREGTRSSLFDRKGTLNSAVPLPSVTSNPEKAQDVLLTSSTGLTTKVRLLSSPEGKVLPGVILLDGIKQGRRVVDYPAIDEINRHAVVISMDYPLDSVKDLSAWHLPLTLPSFRQAALDSVSAVLLMVDYLETRPDVDEERIILVGTSFGAPLAVIAGAIDFRPAAVAALYGGGKLGDLIAHEIRKTGRFGRSKISWSAAGFIGRTIAAALLPLEPTRYAPQIAPRPLLLISGLDDELIPRDSVLALYQAARQPKDLLWVSSKHIRATQQDLMRILGRQLNTWLIEQHIL